MITNSVGAAMGRWWGPGLVVGVVTFAAETGLLAARSDVGVGEAVGSGAYVGAALGVSVLLLVADAREVAVRGVPWSRVLMWAGWIGLVVGQIAYAGPDPGDWDVLFLSGTATLLAGLELTRAVPLWARDAVERLRARGVLIQEPEEQARFAALLPDWERRWRRRGSVALAAVMGVAALALEATARESALVYRLWWIAFLTLLAWIAGARIGAMIAHGWVWTPMSRTGATLVVVPGHLDGAAGLRPLGALFFRQSLIASLPAVFLAVWWWLIPLFPQYEPYREQYLALLPVAMAVEVLVFLVPLLQVHRLMAERKQVLLARADGLSREVDDLRSVTTTAGSSADDRSAARARAVDLAEEYERIESCPTWPLDLKIRRRFSLNTVALLLPFAGSLVGHTDLWRQIADVLSGLSSA